MESAHWSNDGLRRIFEYKNECKNSESRRLRTSSLSSQISLSSTHLGTLGS